MANLIEQIYKDNSFIKDIEEYKKKYNESVDDNDAFWSKKAPPFLSVGLVFAVKMLTFLSTHAPRRGGARGSDSPSIMHSWPLRCGPFQQK